jgi:phosphatidate cytidylyltransferase
MLIDRLRVLIILLPLGLAAIALGGIVYALAVTLILCLAALEYSQLFHTGGYQPAGFLAVIGAGLFSLGRYWNGFESSAWILAAVVMLSMAYHLVQYERGRDLAGTEFGITVGGVLYIGWLGAYLVSLRTLPEGMWWTLVVLLSVWLADSGAYIGGTLLGRHKISPRLSPKKSLEGYLAGILTGAGGTAGLAALWRTFAGPGSQITPLRGALIGLVVAVLTIFGDLGISMIKRQVGAKDSGKLLPGHGGMLDRIDTWLWAAVIGYYMITTFFLR